MPATRARTVIATNEIQNIDVGEQDRDEPLAARCAFTNIESSDDPSTISGEAIARKITKFIAPAPRKRYRPSASPMNVPRIVATIVARNATSSDELSDVDRSGNEKRFRHASSDACSHLMLYRPPAC